MWLLPIWGIAGAAYGAALILAALTQPIARRGTALLLAAAFAAGAIVAGRFAEWPWVALAAPGGLLLGGYWLSGLFFHAPQPWLEAWLLRTDRAVGAPELLARLPRAAAELLELTYASVHAVVGLTAIYAALAGIEALTTYWNVVLTSSLASFVALPWLRSRPPRAIEGGTPGRTPTLRRLNAAILDKASVQANTLPSGHVASGTAAALGVISWSPAIGGLLLAVAALIAIAATAGRYHYAADCVAGAAVACGVWLMVG